MRREIFTHFLPNLFDSAELRGGMAVVIDVLRASTTICHALAAGATAVLPCGEVEEALRLKQELAVENPVLGGEREGKLIDGFDLDNSPFRYTPENVAGRAVVFTTTNGTLRSAAVRTGGANCHRRVYEPACGRAGVAIV